MTTVDTRGAQFNDRGEVFAAEELSAAEEGSRDGGLVLPQEVVADLAGQLVARAAAGERVALAGRDGRRGRGGATAGGWCRRRWWRTWPGSWWPGRGRVSWWRGRAGTGCCRG